MASLTPRFSSNRMLRQYVEDVYLPAGVAVQRRSAEGGRLARELHAWGTALAAHWGEVRVLAIAVGREGDHWRFDVQVALGAIAPDWVRVELYAEPLEDDAPVRVVMDRVKGTEGIEGGDAVSRYRASVPASRSASDYTPRIVPHHPDVSIPMEAAQIRWPR